MDFFDTLIREEPFHKKTRTSHFRSLGICSFVRSHFNGIQAVRRRGYSWGQIAHIVSSRIVIPSRNLTQSLKAAYSRERKRKEHHGE